MAHQNIQPQSLVIANNDIVYLWWTYPHKIPNCLGFSIHRILDEVEESKGLYATVGFSLTKDTRKSPQTTDEWPIQSFNWKDVYPPHGKRLAYRIIPMVMKGSNWKNLIPDPDHSILTDEINSTQQFGDVKIIFNRGLLSTQAFSKSILKTATSEDEEQLKKEANDMIRNPSKEWRKRLAGQILHNIHAFFKQEGKFYCALYELSDEELISILLDSKAVEVILSTSDSNESSRKRLHDAMAAPGGKLKIYDRFMKANSIGHNKFVVFTDEQGTAQSVLTGSTNWTPTGLCGQTNNLVIIHNPLVAARYMHYWNELYNDTSKEGKGLQGQTLRTWCRQDGGRLDTEQATSLKLWYSPNTVKNSKPKPVTPDAIPVDLQEVASLLRSAKKQILYLVFNPGTPSIIDWVREAAIVAKNEGNPIFVRGAVSDLTIGKRVTTNIISKDATLPPDTYKVTGVASIPGKFSYWERELLKLGFATIHDKILVIDPFDAEHCSVVTGSHNLGLKASYANDENMLLIQGSTAIAKAYAAHILDVVNHFKWRYKLQNRVGGKKGAALTKALENAWNDLEETDAWMDYYYDENGDLEKEQLLFKP